MSEQARQRTRVKICGITSVEDAQKVAEAGADAIGLVFYPPSPRGISVAEGARICSQVSPFVTVVGLFVDPGQEEVRTVLDRCSVDILQFHGEEPWAFCSGFGRRFLKAIRMTPSTDALSLAKTYGPYRLLLDAHVPGQVGGTGRSFQWSAVPAELVGRAVLAGGLTPENVEEAVSKVRPFAVDVSSGVEERPGVKSADRVAAFVQGVRDGDSRQSSG